MDAKAAKAIAHNDQFLADIIARIKATIISPQGEVEFNQIRVQVVINANREIPLGMSEPFLSFVAIQRACLQIGCAVLQEHAIRWADERKEAE